MYHIDWFAYIELFIYLSKEYIPLDYGEWSFECAAEFGLLDFIENFCIYIHQEHWLVVFLSSSALFWFLYQDNINIVKWIWQCFLLFDFFWKSLNRTSVNSSLNIWKKSCKTIESWASSLGDFWLLIQSPY